MALSMLGMIVVAPAIGQALTPVFDGFYKVFGIDPSVIPASLFANDMGGASLSLEMAADEGLGFFNGLVVSSMMGCTISYTVPFALGIVKKELHGELLLGTHERNGRCFAGYIKILSKKWFEIGNGFAKFTKRRIIWFTRRNMKMG